MKTSLLLIGLGFAAASMPVTALADGDPVKGKALFAQCMACHTVDKARKSGVGPNLAGVVNRPIASVAGFAFSPALMQKKGRWTVSLLDAYIASPAKTMPGTRMPYGGMQNPASRQDLVAYLAAVSK